MARDTYIFFLSSLLFLGAAYACNHSQQPEEAPPIPVEIYDFGTTLDFSSFLKAHKIISLSAPKQEAFIKDIERLLFADNRIFVMDRSGNKIVMFDGEGNFLKSTAKMIGRGHNEYLRVIDASIDEKNKKLYVHCDAPYQMMIFDLDLNLEKIIPMNYYMTEMTVDEEFIYGLCHQTPPVQGFCLVALEKSHPDMVPDTLLSFHNVVPGRMTFGKSLTTAQKGAYVSFPFDTHIYKLRQGKITETYNMDFGEHGLITHPLPENITPELFDRYNNGLHWSIVSMSESDSLLLFNTNSFELFVTDKATRQCKGYKEYYNDLLRFHCGRIIPTQGLQNGVVFHSQVHNIEETLKIAKEKGNIPFPNMAEIPRKYNPDSNPLIVVWDIK